MQICCTKKLQDKISFNIEELDDTDDIFCWSANLIILNRRKAVVVVNDYSRFGFVLYGLKVKELKKLDQLILEGIKRTFKAERIKSQIIENYIKDASKIKFTKTRARTYVTRLNRSCELVKYFIYEIDKDNIYQSLITRELNNGFFIYNEQCKDIRELLHEGLKSLYGEDILQTECIDFIAKLDLDENVVVREIVAPLYMTFKEFHNIMQAAFDWKDNHLYNFDIIDNNGNLVKRIVDDKLNEKMQLIDYYESKYKIIYRYDFEDNWEHEITIKEINNNYHKNYPICLMGEGTLPIEYIFGDETFLALTKEE